MMGHMVSCGLLSILIVYTIYVVFYLVSLNRKIVKDEQDKERKS